MAITFLEQKKKQQQLLSILVFLIIITSFVVWWGFLKEEVVFQEITSEMFRGVNINFEFLRDFVPQDFEFFEKTPVFEEQIGRENPFLPLSPQDKKEILNPKS